jgi:ADP-ribose pyrophosphatase YjhB (NUDIX family)
MNYQVFTKQPSNFVSSTTIVGCYIQVNDTLLLCKRHEQKSQGGKWGVPAGKVEKGEELQEALIREVREEIAVNLNKSDIVQIKTLFIHLSEKIEYTYHMFYTTFKQQPLITLKKDELVEARWLTIQNALTLPLIKGAKEALSYYEQFIHEK